MNKFIQATARIRTRLAAATAAVVIWGLMSALYSAEPNSSALPPQTNAASSQTNSPDTNSATEEQISGAELYSIHCNRCHPERYPTERTAANWKTIMLHMQVRANIPVSQARLILKYLQENSGR